MDQVRDLALEHRPKMIVAGTTSYPRRLDPEPFRAIADEVGALFMFDAAHIAGLIAGGAHPNPVPYADVVTFTTHKTLRGPRGGCILSKAEHAKAIDKAVFPGWQGGPLEHVIAGKAVAFREALRPDVHGLRPPDRDERLGAGRGAGRRGLPPRVGRHRQPPDGRRPAPVRRRADRQGGPGRRSTRPGITLNKNTIPDDPRSPFVTSGVRIGTPSVTTQGMKEPEMAAIAGLIARALRGRDDAGRTRCRSATRSPSSAARSRPTRRRALVEPADQCVRPCPVDGYLHRSVVRRAPSHVRR